MTLQERLLANPTESPEATVEWWMAELKQEPKDYKMPDIMLCDSHVCSRKTTCHRNPSSGTKPDGEWQSWGVFDPDRCSNYWPVERKRTLNSELDAYLGEANV